MSAMCQKRTFDRLVDHLIGSHQYCARYRQAECFQSLFINGETEAGWRGVLRRLQNDSQNQTDPLGGTNARTGHYDPSGWDLLKCSRCKADWIKQPWDAL